MNNEHSDLEINIIDELKFIFQNKFKLMLISVFFSSVFAFYSMTIPKEYLSQSIPYEMKKIYNSQKYKDNVMQFDNDELIKTIPLGE